MFERQIALEKAQGFRGPATRLAGPIDSVSEANLAIRESCISLLGVSLIFFVVLARASVVGAVIASLVVALPAVVLLVSRHPFAGVVALVVPALGAIAVITAPTRTGVGGLLVLIVWLYLSGRGCRAAFRRRQFLSATSAEVPAGA